MKMKEMRMKKRGLTLLLIALFIVGAVVEGIRHGATLMLLQNVLFAVGVGIELLPSSEDKGRWSINKIISTTCIIGAGVILWYSVFSEL